MIKVKCPDCFRDIEIEDDVKLYICRCGACAFDREVYSQNLKADRREELK